MSVIGDIVAGIPAITGISPVVTITIDSTSGLKIAYIQAVWTFASGNILVIKKSYPISDTTSGLVTTSTTDINTDITAIS